MKDSDDHSVSLSASLFLFLSHQHLSLSLNLTLSFSYYHTLTHSLCFSLNVLHLKWFFFILLTFFYYPISSAIISRNNILAREIFDISEYLKVFSLDQRMRASLWLPLISHPLTLFMFVLKSVCKLSYNVVFNIFFLPPYPVPPIVAYSLLS